MFLENVSYLKNIFRDELDKADVNSMTVRPEEDKLYAGCGDNKIYCYDLDGGKLIRTFQGHDDYIHCVHST
jgi:THO complex subunit 6